MKISNPLPFFAVVTLTAPALIVLGSVSGGGWALAGFLWIGVLTAFMDELIGATVPTVTGQTSSTGEFPSSDWLSITLAAAHFAVWVQVIRAASGATGLETWEKCVLVISAGLFMGQVSNSNAHELIHRPGRTMRRAGRWLYISVLFGHHFSAHTLVHHIHVGTENDPSTARLGEGYYSFFFRAWKGGFVKGLHAENKRFPRLNRPSWRHPYVAYVGGALAFIVAAYFIGGGTGVFTALCLAALAQIQMMQADYVQHYGLSRQILPNGRPEPAGDRHSWNAPHFMSSALMLNAPRHSDHHANPLRPFPSLRLSHDMPMLPRSLPVMAALALVPSLWRRVMDHRALQWQHVD